MMFHGVVSLWGVILRTASADIQQSVRKDLVKGNGIYQTYRKSYVSGWPDIDMTVVKCWEEDIRNAP
jgi:hypothetical protein